MGSSFTNDAMGLKTKNVIRMIVIALVAGFIGYAAGRHAQIHDRVSSFEKTQSGMTSSDLIVMN